MTDAKLIEKRVDEIGPGKAFTSTDFTDLSSSRNVCNVLGRLYSRGKIARAVRGVYYVPEKSSLLNKEVPLSAEEVTRAIARSNKWAIAPAGDTALNAVGLDTQVPARLTFVSSGPYKSYVHGSITIEFKHRASRDLLDCSETTCTLVQALKALGKEGVDDRTISFLASRLTKDQVNAFRDESYGLTSWVAEVAQKLWEAKNEQDSEGQRA